MTYKRNRLLYAMMTIVVIVLGLCSRKIAHMLPHILNTYLGDALWALMIFIGFGFLFKGAHTKTVALLVLLFCYIIEFSQLYHASWIDHIRETTLGGLVLGYGFLWSDLLAYAIGIGVGVISEMLFVLIRKPSNLT
ncbi:DUF2809 domain-containing protein [Bacillus sp. FJAT-53711]|uniref:DUF2809 domain-containing protein n=1 Tax=Bacillus yunxiaonensis TaxID=3127665 RepID=A0ABU8FRL1_9BACI